MKNEKVERTIGFCLNIVCARSNTRLGDIVFGAGSAIVREFCEGKKLRKVLSSKFANGGAISSRTITTESMKRTFKYALSVVLGLGLVGSALAQQSFADVQDSHWAADAVNRLKITGFIQGFPDGKFNGTNNVTRYEMASFVYAVYAKLVCFNEEVEKKIKDLEAKINNVKLPEPEKPKQVDYSEIRKSISDLNVQVSSFKSWSSDLKSLKSLGDKYSVELKSLGVDMADFKKRVSALSDRISALEKRTENVRISGDANFFVSGASRGNNSPVVINQDGRFILPPVNGAGLDTLRVNHEAGIVVQNAVDAEIPVRAELVLGNFFTNGVNGFGTQTDFNGNSNTPFDDNGFAAYLNRLEAFVPKYNTTVGRQGMKLSPYVLQRMDVNSFYSTERDDNGEWTMDGLKIGFGKGSVTGTAFLGRFANLNTTAGGNIQPLDFGFGNIERLTGASLNLGKYATASFIQLDNNGVNALNNPTGANRQEIWGVDANVFDRGNVALTGGYGQSRTKDGSTTVVPSNSENARWNADLKVASGALTLMGGYRRIEQNYNAPGDWGRVSVVRNLNDFRGFNAGLDYKLSEKSHLFGRWERGERISANGEFTNYLVGLGFGLTSRWDATVTYEDAKFDNGFFFTPGAQSKFTTLGLNYNANPNSTLRLFYQNSEFNQQLSTDLGFANALRGGFFGAQYSVRF